MADRRASSGGADTSASSLGHLARASRRRLQRVVDLARARGRGRAGRRAAAARAARAGRPRRRGSRRSVGTRPADVCGCVSSPTRLELGELVADGRRRDAEPAALDEVLRADGLPRARRTPRHAPQDVQLARRSGSRRRHHGGLYLCAGNSGAPRRGARPSRRRRAAARAASGPPSRPRRRVRARPGRAAPPAQAPSGSTASSSPASGERLVEPEPEQHPLVRRVRPSSCSSSRWPASRPPPARAR